jgi:hypothetical protein
MKKVCVPAWRRAMMLCRFGGQPTGIACTYAARNVHPWQPQPSRRSSSASSPVAAAAAAAAAVGALCRQSINAKTSQRRCRCCRCRSSLSSSRLGSCRRLVPRLIARTHARATQYSSHIAMAANWRCSPAVASFSCIESVFDIDSS